MKSPGHFRSTVAAGFSHRPALQIALVILAGSMALISAPLSASADSHAADEAGASEMQDERNRGKHDGGACKDDRERYCKDVDDRRGMRKCMKEHASELSDECRTQITKKKEKAEKRRRKNRAIVEEACEIEIQQWCDELMPEDKGVISCLREHEGRLGRVCRQSLPLEHRHKKGKGKGKGKKGADANDVTADPVHVDEGGYKDGDEPDSGSD